MVYIHNILLVYHFLCIATFVEEIKSYPFGCMHVVYIHNILLVYHILCTATFVEEIKTYPFGLLVDGSNNTGVQKLNPLTVRVLDTKIIEVTTQLHYLRSSLWYS